MKINPHIFRGYDLRGEVGKDLSPAIIEHIGKAYGTFLAKRRIKQAVVGYDCRLTSPEYAEAVARGLISTGVSVIDLGLSLSQLMYYGQYYFRSNGGVIITASHNPKNYNGMKLALGYSNTLVTNEIQEIRKIAEAGKFTKGNGKIIKINRAKFIGDYYQDLLNRINATGIQKKKFKVVIDASDGTTAKFMPDLLKLLNCKVVCQNCKMDGNFPHGTPDPTEKEIMERLAKRVLQEKADVGFAYDADGDRIGVADDKGGYVWNDVLVALFASDVIEHLPGAKIVYNALCSRVVDDVIKDKGGKGIMWVTGHSFIKEKVAVERAPFGGELSGHFFFVDNFFGHDDGAYATLRVLDYLVYENRKLSDILAEFPKYISSPEIKFGCADDIKVNLVDNRLKKRLSAEFKKEKITTIDGVRVDFADKMFIVRYSQNGPYITVKFEAKKQKDYDALKTFLKKTLKEYPEIDFKNGTNTDALN